MTSENKLGLTAFEVSQFGLPPGAESVAHDHDDDQVEDVYVFRRGNRWVVVDGVDVAVEAGTPERYPTFPINGATIEAAHVAPQNLDNRAMATTRGRPKRDVTESRPGSNSLARGIEVIPRFGGGLMCKPG